MGASVKGERVLIIWLEYVKDRLGGVGMDLVLIEQKAREVMGERLSHRYREPGYIFTHGQRVGRIALQLRKLIYPGQEQDDSVILVGSWFHDVGKGIEPHWEYGALLVRELLRDLCSPVELGQIAEIVGNHTLRKQKPFPAHVKLVQDADILDHFGSQEIWLNFNRAARSGGGLGESLRFYDEQYAANVLKARKLLNYREAIEFFDKKDEFVQEFVERFRLEATGGLFAEKGKG